MHPLKLKDNTPIFERESFASQHWPLAWIALLLALMVWLGSVLLGSVNDTLGTAIKNQSNQVMVAFSKEYDSSTATLPRGELSLLQRHNVRSARDHGTQLDAWRDTFRVLSVDLSNVGRLTKSPQERQYVEWQLHRQTAFAALRAENLARARSEFEICLSLANALGREEPMVVQSQLDLAWINLRTLLEYEHRASVLQAILLPCFSLVAAFLPFLLIVRFLRRRRVSGQFNESVEENFSEILWVKLLTAASWCMAIAGAWVAVRNYAFGVDDVVLSGAVNATIFSLVAMALGLCLLLRYMPPTRNLTMRAMIIQCGFGGLLLSLKAAGIYMALCLALASHPGVNQFLFLSNTRESLRKEMHLLVQAAERNNRAIPNIYNRVFKAQIYNLKLLSQREALDTYVKDLPEKMTLFPRVAALTKLKKDAAIKFERALTLRFTSRNIANNIMDGAVPNEMFAGDIAKVKRVDNRTALLWLIFELCCLFTAIVYPEALAYLFSLARKPDSAFRWFERAIRIKTYILGENHWHIASMRMTFGRVLTADYHKQSLDKEGELQMKEAIAIYEISCGRHAEETLAAKLILANYYQKRGNSIEAEKILLEARQDAGSNLDLVPYCRLLSQLGAIYLAEQNLARAKSIYREQIDLLTKALAASPPQHGFWAMFRSTYLSQSSWQIEVALTLAQLGLAEVYERMRYEGEVERLIADAIALVKPYEMFLGYYEELTSAYVKAHAAQANLFMRQGRIDQALKSASDCLSKLEKTNYISRPFGVELLELTNRLRLQKMANCSSMEKKAEQRLARQTFDLLLAAKYSNSMFMSSECSSERKKFEEQLALLCPQNLTGSEAAVSSIQTFESSWDQSSDHGFSIKYDHRVEEAIPIRVRK